MLLFANAGLRDSPRECSILTDPQGLILSGDGDARKLFNLSWRHLLGRDLYLFFQTDRMQVRTAITALGPNLGIERNVMVRPRDHRPLLARVMITRQADDHTVRWDFSV